MATAKVTSNGRITIPKDVRDQLGLEPGDEVTFAEGFGGWYIRKEDPTPVGDSPFTPWRGYLKHLAGRRSDDLVEEMRGPPLDPDELTEETRGS